MNVLIRSLEEQDIPQIAEAFQRLGWNKPASQYEQYFREQSRNIRNVFIALESETFIGYITICWQSKYPPFNEAYIPEIADLNVLPPHRRRGIATTLMDKAEHEITKNSSIAGIGVGMTAEYGAAHRMYVLRGYLPDGRGICYNYQSLKYGEQTTVDDDLVLYFTKQLKKVP